MKLKFLLTLGLCVALCQSAVIRKNSRPKRTLGLLTAGGSAVGAGLGAAGSAAATAFGVAASAKPLILLGLGKYALLNMLSRPGSQVGITLGYNAPNYQNYASYPSAAGSQPIVVNDGSYGYPSAYEYTQPQEPIFVEQFNESPVYYENEW
ncbi:hypothetical protein TCAL_15761 [Tigriopus californicus]|uniref:Uncharacterized protein n=1 Tax=Tigriopus californicus TaxID=6832 RepID=A0A553P795_TIGCA|nr:uncharacterized protein LOC131877976 [Tigriopus californicus]TRY73555.1 hypothetical protein TCAL_15761 [Tigriopus californicus]